MTLKTITGWFELGRMVGRYVWPLRPKPNEIRNAAQILGITMRDARRAVDYYTWGDEKLIAGKPVPNFDH